MFVSHSTHVHQVTTSQLTEPGTKHSVLMLAETPQEKQRWVGALTELHKILKKNELPNLASYQCKELYDSSLLLLKNPLSACIYGELSPLDCMHMCVCVTLACGS